MNNLIARNLSKAIISKRNEKNQHQENYKILHNTTKRNMGSS
jgi:hypothetical protein